MDLSARFVLAAAAFSLALSACGASAPAAGAGVDAGATGTDGAVGTDVSAGTDGTADGGVDSSADTGGAADVGPDSATVDAADVAADSAAPDVPSTNKACTFNADCIDSERCECTESAGCFCKIGARGTGKSGVDICKDGNDCETALCVEGPKYQTSYYCSGPCSSDADCGKMLPICSNIAFIGKICIRDPQAKP